MQQIVALYTLKRSCEQLAMPPKKAAKTTTKCTCDVCDAAILEGKEDALQCEGACQMWFHRYCAGVSLSHFKHLSNTSKPFVCSFCSPDVHQAVVCQLQSEITVLKDDVKALSEAKQALSDEVRLLKAAMTTLHKQTQPRETQTGAAGATKVANGNSSTDWTTVAKPATLLRQSYATAATGPARHQRGNAS